MAIPSPIVPKFEVIIPSTGKAIKMRPYTVAEEKLLKIANNDISDDSLDTIPKKLDVVKDIIQRCIVSPNDFKIDSLAIFDIEYILIKLCQESGGNTIRVNFPGDESSSCDRCKENKIVVVDLSKTIVMKNPEHTNKIDLVDNIGVIMKYPIYAVLNNILLAKSTNDFELMLSLFVECIDKFFDDKKIYDDFTKDEAMDFLSNLTIAQIQKLDNFFNTMPSVQLTIDMTCKACGKQDSYTMRGIHDFF